MEERPVIYTNYNTNFSDPLLRDIRILLDILNPLVSSYRLLVGAADEFNGITLAHKSDLEAAIKRADDMGAIIDDIDKKLKILVKELTKKIGSSDNNIINIEPDNEKGESSD